MDTPGKRPQLVQASTISPEDTVVIIQGGFQKKLPISYLLAAGQSGFSGVSGVSGFSGINGEYAASGFSGFSGLSGISGFSGQSAFIDIKSSHLLYSDEAKNVTHIPNVTTNGKTIEIVNIEGEPQLIIKSNTDPFKSISTAVNDTETSISFQNNPYSKNVVYTEHTSGDLIVKTSTYGKNDAEIIRIKNAEQSILLSKKLITTPANNFEAGFNIPLGERPETIKDGDIWRENAGIFIQTGKSLIGPLSSSANVTSWNKNKLVVSVNDNIQPVDESTLSCMFFRRVGDSMECRIDFRQNKGIIGDVGEYLIVVPDNLTVDSDKINFMIENSFGSIGSGILYDGIPNNITFQPRDGHHLAVIVNNRSWTSNSHSLSNNQFNLIGSFTIPITEWK